MCALVPDPEVTASPRYVRFSHDKHIVLCLSDVSLGATSRHASITREWTRLVRRSAVASASSARAEITLAAGTGTLASNELTKC